MTQVNNRRGGCYWIGSEPFISVTTILKEAIDKPALRYWYGKMVYEAVIKDPYISEQEALAAPTKTAKTAGARGSTIHSLIEAYKETGAVVESVPENIRGYAEAFYDWSSKNELQVIESERTVVNQEYKFAGTLDMLATLNGQKVIIDFKTSKKGTIYDEAHLQVSAYKHSLDELCDGYIVSLAEDGTWTQVKAKDRFDVFLNCLNIYTFINSEKLQKWGWKGKYE